LRPRDAAELIVLAAIWGGSFLFMRIAVPAFGPMAIAALRVTGASLLLVPLLTARGDLGLLRRHWRPIAVLGVTNSALPFFGFAYAAITTGTGVLAIFNSASPLFAAVVAWLWLGDRMTPARVAGLAIGFAGIVWIIVYKAGLHAGGTPLAILACLMATVCYGVSPSVTKRYLSGTTPLVVAAGSQLVGAALLAIPAVLAWPATVPSLSAWGVVAAPASVCTGLAQLMYFRLIAHAGPANAISVTYLIPIFAIAWGSLFLDEAITWPLLTGCAVVFPAPRSRPGSSGRGYRLWNDVTIGRACGSGGPRRRGPPMRTAAYQRQPNERVHVFDAGAMPWRKRRARACA
jgi:drug/metabolite transporter (DMT)-like permease